MSVVDTALTYLGVPYLYGGNDRNGIDCSALMQQSYKANGINIPRVAQDQYNQSTKIEYGDLKPGDLIFEGSSVDNISHVLMYIGNGQAIESPRTGYNVRITDLNTRTDIVGYGRYLNSDTDTGSQTSVTQTDNSGGIVNGVLSKIVKFLFILMILVIAVVFLMKAFDFKF